jgi:uncharacterized protein (TIGR02145 family)
MKSIYTFLFTSVTLFCFSQVPQSVNNDTRLIIDSIESKSYLLSCSVNEVINSKLLIMYYGAVGTFDKITLESEGVTGIKLELMGVGNNTPFGRAKPLSNFPIKSDLSINNGIMHFTISGIPKLSGVAKFDLNVGNKRISIVVNIAEQKLTQVNNSSSNESVQNPTMPNNSSGNESVQNPTKPNSSNSAAQTKILKIDSVESKLYQLTYLVNDVINNGLLIPYYGAVGTFDKVILESEGVTGIKLELRGVGDNTAIGRAKPYVNFPLDLKSQFTNISNGIMHFSLNGNPNEIGVARFNLSIGGKNIFVDVNVVDSKLTLDSLVVRKRDDYQFGPLEKGITVDFPAGKVLHIKYFGAIKGQKMDSLCVVSKGVEGLVLRMPASKIYYPSSFLEISLKGTPLTSGEAIFDIKLGGKNCTLKIPVIERLTIDSIDRKTYEFNYFIRDIAKEGDSYYTEWGFDGGGEYYGKIKNFKIPYFGAVGTLDKINLESSGVTGMKLLLEAVGQNQNNNNTPNVVQFPVNISKNVLTNGLLYFKLSGTPSESGVAKFDFVFGNKEISIQVNVKPSIDKNKLPAEILTFFPYHYVSGTSFVNNCTNPAWTNSSDFYNCGRDEALIKDKNVKTQIKMSFTKKVANALSKVTSISGFVLNGQSIKSYGVKGLVATFAGVVCDENTNSVVFEVQGIPQSGGTAIFDLKLNNMTCKVKLKVLDPIYTFQAAKIGNTSWMTENLAVRYFRNGDPIPLAQSNEEWKKAAIEKRPAMCFYLNDSTNAFTNFTDGRYDVKYGVLYNWYAVVDGRGLAPVGWAIPSVGINRKDGAGNSTIVRAHFEELSTSAKIEEIKSKWGWKANLNGTNTKIFSALPGGGRLADGTFVGGGEQANWWFTVLDDDFYAGSNFVYSDASKIETFGKVVSLGESKNTLETNKPDGGCGYSIRCILSITSDLRDYNVNVLSGNQLTGIKDLNQNKKEPEGGLAPEFTEEEFQGEEEKN